MLALFGVVWRQVCPLNVHTSLQAQRGRVKGTTGVKVHQNHQEMLIRPNMQSHLKRQHISAPVSSGIRIP